MRMRPAVLSLLSIVLLVAAANGATRTAAWGLSPTPQDQPQDQYPAPPPDQGQYQDQGPDQDQPPPAFQNFSAEELDNLLAPIALYPDPLLAQVLVAATFPDQVDEAARYLRAGADPNTIDDQPWDVSVKSVAHYPTVLYMMDNRLDWTTSVGQAYVNQSTDVQESIQRLRQMAHNAGTLQSSPQMEVVQQGPYWDIYPVNPQLIYVPVYDPAFVFYGRPGWHGPFITFGVGFPIGCWLNLGFGWGGPGIYYFGWGATAGLPPWALRSRPFVRVTNVYVNERFRNVAVNREVIHRPVAYDNLHVYNSVHGNVNLANHQPRTFQAAGARPGQQRYTSAAPNQIVQRNINVGDSRIQDFRGREGGGPRMTMEGQGKPAPPAPAARPAEERPAPQRAVSTPAPQPSPQPQPAARPAASSAYNVERGSFSPAQSSARGQASYQQMSRPAPAPRPAPVSRPAPAPRPSGGGRRP